MNNLVPVTLDMLLDDRCEMVGRFDRAGEGYEISYCWDDNHVERGYLSLGSIYAVDPRLPAVFEALMWNNHHIDTTLVKLTVTSHWARNGSNHNVDPEYNDDGSRISNWRIHQLLEVEPSTRQAETVHVRLEVYLVASTDSGVEYATKSMVTSLERDLTWLDKHFDGGTTLLALLQSIGAPSDEAARAMQAHYIPVFNTHSIATDLPNDISAGL